MLKTTMAATILLAALFCPQVRADDADDSGFGGASLPSETTNTQTEQFSMPGNEPLAPPGLTQRTATQGRGSFNIPNLPKVTTASIARPGTSLQELPDARYAILSNGDGLGGDTPTRYATDRGTTGSDAKGAVNLQPARYAILSDKNKSIGDDLSKLKELGTELPKKFRASEGF